MNRPYNQKTDVWALGCIIYEMLTLKKAYSGGYEDQIRQKIIDQPPPKLPKNDKFSKDIQLIYELCMQKDPKLRPSIKDILQLPII